MDINPVRSSNFDHQPTNPSTQSAIAQAQIASSTIQDLASQIPDSATKEKSKMMETIAQNMSKLQHTSDTHKGAIHGMQDVQEAYNQFIQDPDDPDNCNNLCNSLNDLQFNPR